MSCILAVVHPEQYEIGLAILDRIQKDPLLLRQPEYAEGMLKIWCCPFSGMSVLCNARTPEHRDSNGRDNWYDLLATVGTYHQHKLRLPGFHTSVSYNPGTVVAICGRVIAHAVDFVEEGDRVCYAWFMRDDVRFGLNLPKGNFSTVQQYESIVA